MQHNPRIRWTVACVAALLAATVTAWAFAPQLQLASEYRIGPQDVLAITVFEQADLGGKYTVETDGTFTFPMIGRVKAAGLTLRQFEAELRARLADGYFVKPQVSVGIEQYRSQRIFIMGEVRSPGTYPLTGDMTLIEALAKAGATASGEIVIVRPKGARGPTLPGQDQDADVRRIDLKELQGGQLIQNNVDLRDGDTVFVPRPETMYVFGQVRSPGAYSIQKGTTVLQALSLAGGLTENGAINRIKVVRLVDGKKIELKMKISDVVQPGDTLIVPERYF